MIQDIVNIPIFLLAVAIVFTVAINAEIKAGRWQPLDNAHGFETKVEYDNTKRLHTYHGTCTSYIKNDTWLFLRDGSVCSLYNPLTRTDR